MNVSERLFIGRILIDEFERLAGTLDSCDDKLSEIIIKAIHVKLKMERFYMKWEKPPELWEQINQMERVIKKLEILQNKYVTDL